MESDGHFKRILADVCKSVSQRCEPHFIVEWRYNDQLKQSAIFTEKSTAFLIHLLFSFKDVGDHGSL